MRDMKRTYEPTLTKAQTWEYIENRFRTNFGGVHLKMAELVHHIRSSDLATRLFAYASMDKLVVSIYENIDYRKEALHITFNLNSNEWNFQYFAVPFKDPEFERVYPCEKGIDKFDNFLKMIRW